MEVYKQENPHINWEHWALMPAPESPLVAQVAAPETSISVAPDDVPLVFDPDQTATSSLMLRLLLIPPQGEQPQPEADAVTQPPSDRPETDSNPETFSGFGGGTPPGRHLLKIASQNQNQRAS